MDLTASLAAGPLVLDGGLATYLEGRGHDLSSGLWSARLLRDDPEAIVDAHRAFLAAGAGVVTTASYQASLAGLAAAGIDPAEGRRLLGLSVRLARTAAGSSAGSSGGPIVVAASVGPFGAMLADGSEYSGAYADPEWTGRAAGGLSVRELREHHRPQLVRLAEAGADVLACETVPCLAEAEALAAEVDALGVPAWLSLTTVTGRDGRVLTRRGEPAAEAFALARDVGALVAVGVNCTDPDGAADAVEVAARASGKPVVVYPNSGEQWDAASRSWRSAPPGTVDVADAAAGWVERGARLVGGCCRVGPDTIRRLARALG